MNSLPLKDYAIGALVIAIIGGGIGWTYHERSVGALEVRLAQTEARADTLTKIADTLAVVASGAAQQAAHQKAQAQYQLAVGRAAQAKADSVAREASRERERANTLLADSLATVQALRQEVGRLVVSGRSDSVSNAGLRAADQRSISALLAAINGSDTTDASGKVTHRDGYVEALAAEQTHTAGLQALVDLRVRELALVRAQQPSFLSKHASVTVGYGCDVSGAVHCGPSVTAGVRLLP